MIKDVFLIFFSDPTVATVLIGAIIVVGVLIIVSDLIWGR